MNKQRRPTPWWKLALLDLLLIGLVLGGYWLLIRQPVAPAPVPVSLPVSTPAPTPAAEEDPNDPAVKFREHFSGETVITETGYRSPNIAITITTHHAEDPARLAQLTYYVADIYLADPGSLATHLADGEDHDRSSGGDPLELAAEAGAILAMTGDYEALSYGGIIIRGGRIYRQETGGQDACVLFSDGRIACYDAGTAVLEELVAQGAVEAWNFGPTLVENGAIADNLYLRRQWYGKAPRTALGYYEPGHYCFVVADGRQDGYSDGADLEEMARIMVDLGCVTAYNMDGGGSAFMSFNGQRVNRQSSERRLSDIILIREPEGTT